VDLYFQSGIVGCPDALILKYLFEIFTRLKYLDVAIGWPTYIE